VYTLSPAAVGRRGGPGLRPEGLQDWLAVVPAVTHAALLDRAGWLPAGWRVSAFGTENRSARSPLLLTDGDGASNQFASAHGPHKRDTRKINGKASDRHRLDAVVEFTFRAYESQPDWE
jgi:hypothetical protein